MEKGIICFETGEFAKYSTENQFAALPLLEFMKQAMGIDYIYRQIATRQELEYYLKKIGDKRFQNKFDVVYFSFHGKPENLCLTQNGKSLVSLDDLAEMADPYESFIHRHIHFSSCKTLDCDDEKLFADSKETLVLKQFQVIRNRLILLLHSSMNLHIFIRYSCILLLPLIKSIWRTINSSSINLGLQ